MNIERVPVESLHFDPANARRHNPQNLKSIEASLVRFGQQKPIVVDKSGVVRAGNGTLAAAKSLGWEEIDIVTSELVGADMTAFAIADNRTAELAEWDQEVLAASLQSLEEEDIAASDLGFTANDMVELFKAIEEDQGEDEIVEDEVPEEPEVPITNPGDLWIMGEHRLLCGDSTNQEHVERLMDGKTASMLFTDPPYGMRLETDYRELHSNHELVRSNSYEAVIGDDEDFDPRPLLERFKEARTVLLWGADWYYDKLPPGGCFVIWNKRTAEGTKDMLGNHFETCWSREKRRRVAYDYLWAGFTARNRDFKREHPTEKPIALIAQMMKDFDSDAELIVDPFLGSGTTLIAAEQLGRTCFGMEISPAYCDVIVQRWQALTGGTAIREAASEA